MTSPVNSSYFYRGTFIHEADQDEQHDSQTVQRSHSAPAFQRVGVSRAIDATTDDERRNYTEKLAEKVDEFVRQYSESSEVARPIPTDLKVIPNDTRQDHQFHLVTAEPLATGRLSPSNFYDAIVDGTSTPDELQFSPVATGHMPSFEHMLLPPMPAMKGQKSITHMKSTSAPRWHEFVPASDLATLDFDGERDVKERRNRGGSHQFGGGHLMSLAPERAITTFMVRNIPCRITKQQLKVSLDSLNLDGTYDFLHLPMTESGTSNLGYFFINFATPELAAEKVSIFEGYRFPNTNSPKVCTIRPARLQGFAANIRQFGCDVRGKVQADVDYNCSQRKVSNKLSSPYHPKEGLARMGGSIMPDSTCFRQVSEISTVAGYDETSDVSESEAGDNATDGEIDRASPSCLAQKTVSATVPALELAELPKGSAVLLKVKRSRPPKFIRERMKRKHRDEALSAAAAASQPTVTQPTSNTTSNHSPPKTSAEATAALRSAAVHLAENCGSRGHDGGHQMYYPTCMAGQQRPPPR